MCLKSLNFSFYLLLFLFANYYQGFYFGLLQWSFKILRGKLARGRPELTPLRMLERLTAVKVEWFRALDLKSGGPWFKSSTLHLTSLC